MEHVWSRGRVPVQGPPLRQTALPAAMEVNVAETCTTLRENSRDTIYANATI